MLPPLFDPSHWWQLALTVSPLVVLQVGNIIVAFINKRKVDELHKGVNGRMEELLRTTAETAYAKGVEAGRAMYRRDDEHKT